MKCPRCKSDMEKVKVNIEGVHQEVISFQCSKCDYVEFEQESANRAILELKAKETPLRIRQKIVKLSKDRLGTYFNKNVIRSLDLKAGEEISISVPDKKHIVILREKEID